MALEEDMLLHCMLPTTGVIDHTVRRDESLVLWFHRGVLSTLVTLLYGISLV